MAIKINNKDLYRRVINGQDVQRVILNGSQIRPTSQPHIDYHVISNRGTGGGGGGSGIPGGWGTSGSVDIGEAGVSNGRTGETANLQYNGLPSLLNAYKVEIIYSFYWNQTETYYFPFESFLENNSSVTYESTISKSSQERLLWLRPFVQSGYIMRDLSEGNYVMTAVLDLENESATLTLEGPNGFSLEIEASLTSTQIFNIRHSTDFWIYLNDGVRLSRVDFYVYNNPQTTGEIYINTDYTVTIGAVGYQIAVYVYMDPVGEGTIEQSGPVEYDHTDYVSGDGYNMIMYYNVTGTGTASVGFHAYWGDSATIQINCIEGEIYINTDLTDTTGIVGNQIAVYYYIDPMGGGVLQKSGPVEYDHTDYVSGDGYNMIMYYNVIGTGVASVGFEVYWGGSTSIQINCIE